MELKNLLTKLKQKEEAPETFFAVEVAEDTVKSAIWTVVDGHTKVVKIGTSRSWDGQSEDKLLTAVDQSISDASDNLPQDPSGVVFGLPESWLDKEDISKTKKTYLKKLCQELELKPLGFVMTNNAVIQYLKIEEGTPPSAIFLQLNSSEINLSLVKLGKTIGTQLVGRSDDLGADVEEGLSRFDKIDTLPSRMILYNGQSDFEEDKQQLMSYDWEEKLPFIHFPKVESLPNDASIKAVALAGGSEVAKSLGFTIKPPVKKDQSGEPDKPSDSKPETTTDFSSKSSTAKSLGFSTADAAKSIDQSADSPSPDEAKDAPEQYAVEVPQQDKQDNFDEPAIPEKTSPAFITSTVQLFKSTSQTIADKLKNLKALRKTPKTPTLIGLGLGLLIIGFFAAYWYIPKAKVIIYVEPKSVDENLEITIDSDATTLDIETNTLPGKSVDISAEGSKSIPTTGTALVGDPAEGDITIYNKTSSSKTFSSGTVLIGTDNLSFTIDEETTIASRSSEEDSEGVITITPGRAQAKITAKSIGPESNLSDGTKLQFKQFSEDDYYAKVEAGLSGGTAREVKAVSKEDKANLLDSLTEELKQKAQQDLQDELGDDQQLVDVEDQDELITKTYNHDVDEEADNLTLEAKLEYTSLSYRQNDLDLLLQQATKEKIPDNYQLSESSELELEPAVLNKDDTATIDVTFEAQLIPKLDFNDLKSNLKGKYPHIIQDYLASISGFVKADITITPNLPEKLKTLPRVTKNITIEIKTQD
ncbi:hypothetical protein ACFL18_00750 [Patescibacteria group bacterium]